MFDPATERFFLLPSQPLRARTEHSLIVNEDGALLVIGGRSGYDPGDELAAVDVLGGP